MRLNRLLVPYFIEQRVGDLHHPRAPMIFEDSQVEPDMMVLPPLHTPPDTWERMPTPLLVVEIASTARRDRLAKRALYVDAGVAEYWIVDGDSRTVTVIRPGQPDAMASTMLTWQPAGAAEPLTIDLPRLFDL